MPNVERTMWEHLSDWKVAAVARDIERRKQGLGNYMKWLKSTTTIRGKDEVPKIDDDDQGKILRTLSDRKVATVARHIEGRALAAHC